MLICITDKCVNIVHCFSYCRVVNEKCLWAELYVLLSSHVTNASDITLHLFFMLLFALFCYIGYPENGLICLF